MLSYCLDCAAKNRSCCGNVNIYLTLADVERIASCGVVEDFYSLEPLTAEYLDGGGDPNWNALILDESGRRRVVRQKPDGNCVFLSDTGCRLASDKRPLLCRIFPFEFLGEKIIGISDYCPVSAVDNWQEVLNESEMNTESSLKWIKQLYREIYQEKNPSEIAAVEDKSVCKCRSKKV